MLRFIEQHCETVVYDRAHDDVYPDSELAKCGFVAICVDTPMAADGACDTSRVEEAVERAPAERILIKSTVTPGTTDRAGRGDRQTNLPFAGVRG